MKRILFPFLFFLSFTILFVQTASAQEASVSAQVKYDLAYPGILPDSPLYKLKVARDKVISFLISDPNKKIDFYLLQADKGISAAAILFDKKEFSLSETTALRAENNMTLLTAELSRLTQKPDNALFTKLKTASLKHQQVLSALLGRLPSEKQKTFSEVIGFSKSNQDTIEKLEKKNPQDWNKSY